MTISGSVAVQAICEASQLGDATAKARAVGR
ncbi:uncharacterized protein METZ01_LOCUS162940 [marine metagenome]|uniref:Uncharacterized protein n=1 Tax=marine metagenome TaxID=408172 RepID=A0A382B8H7_9ZZZZ